ncbi:hypothetical protein P5673_010481 [Acropora cervicornis]|uniref:C2H2-type domain-containing protein n=1 Tax=Acropora cervicornis TaxID=6130 RepID=A0AAD9QQ46_ACRCE|nr:hypothetical protein P5673_010481 [Acropora cervicornis]
MASAKSAKQKSPQKSRGISWKNENVQLLLEVMKEETILFSLDNAKTPKEKKAAYENVASSSLKRLVHHHLGENRRNNDGGVEHWHYFTPLELMKRIFGGHMQVNQTIFPVLSKAALLNYNLFLKRLLQVHVSQSSTVADHCRSYALSDPKELSFQTTYDHDHSDVCERCATLASTLNDIDEALDAQSQNMTSNRKEELFSSQECKDRCIPMDGTRVQLLELTDASSVLIVQDWAMKYLHRKYRESQTDCFGKRGIPWHLTVATTDKTRGRGVADAKDNAGCYHCGTTLVCAAALVNEEGVKIGHLDFSDPQGCKAACDQEAATIKSHMRIYLNAGNDMETTEQIRDAILSSGGVPGVLCETIQVPKERHIKVSVQDPDPQVNIKEEDSNTAIFSCPEEDCIKTFARYSSMHRHLDFGKHQHALEQSTLLDKAAIGYAQKLEGQCEAVPELDADMLQKGWALKSSASHRCRFTYKQKKYLTEKFQQGERSGRKSDPASVAPSMMSAMDSQEKRMFSSEQFLTASRVAGFFFRLAAKKSLFNVDDLEEEIECATQEASIQKLTSEVSLELLQGAPSSEMLVLHENVSQ